MNDLDQFKCSFCSIVATLDEKQSKLRELTTVKENASANYVSQTCYGETVIHCSSLTKQMGAEPYLFSSTLLLSCSTLSFLNLGPLSYENCC